jgi:hypothetical protein
MNAIGNLFRLSSLSQLGFDEIDDAAARRSDTHREAAR